MDNSADGSQRTQILEFVKDSDRLLSGDMIPTVTFSLKRQEQDVEPVPQVP